MAHQNSLNIYEGGTPGVGPANSDMKGVTPKRRAGILKHATVKPLEVESQMSSMTQLSPGPASALYQHSMMSGLDPRIKDSNIAKTNI